MEQILKKKIFWKNKKVLITGHTGFKGSWLSIILNILEANVYGYSLKPKKNSLFEEANIKTKICKNYFRDINDFNFLEKIIKKHKPEIIFHLASDADVKKSFIEPYKVIENNNLITLNLLEAIRLLNLKSIIQICSTSEVYGSVDKKLMPINENCTISPINPYAVSKLFQDMLAYNYYKNFDLKIIITRMFTYLNPRRKNLFASSWAYQLNRIKLKKQKFLFHGNLKSTRTIMDVRDAMRAYWLAAEKCEIGHIYNIGSNNICNLKNFLKLLKKYSGVNFKTKLDKNLLRKSDISYQIPDSTKFNKITKWKPKINIKDSIEFLIKETQKL